jgi:hypothetical protein
VNALNEDIAVEPADDLERAVEKGLFEAELHQHQQHREADAAGRAEEARLVRDEVAPGERNRARAGSGDEARLVPSERRTGNRQSATPECLTRNELSDFS